MCVCVCVWLLLQIKSAPISPRLPSQAALLCNRLTRGILPTFNRQLLFYSNNESNLITLLERQPQASQDIDTY